MARVLSQVFLKRRTVNFNVSGTQSCFTGFRYWCRAFAERSLLEEVQYNRTKSHVVLLVRVAWAHSRLHGV
jgi:hypothetical protein